MPAPVYPRIDKYIRGGIGTDYEPGLEIPGISILKDEYIFAKKMEFSTSVNANSVLGEPPLDALYDSIKSVSDFYGTKSFSWIIKASKKYAYLEEALCSIGMKPEKTFFGMYLPINGNSLKNMTLSDSLILHAENRKQISDLVDLSCEIFGLNVSEREDMIQERMSILLNPSNRSGFHVAYVEGRPVGYSRYRISHDGEAMYLTGSGVIREFRGKHIYFSLLKQRYEIAMKNGCKLLTVFAREDTSKPILEKLGFRTEGKYLFMVGKKQI